MLISASIVFFCAFATFFHLLVFSSVAVYLIFHGLCTTSLKSAFNILNTVDYKIKLKDSEKHLSSRHAILLIYYVLIYELGPK